MTYACSHRSVPTENPPPCNLFYLSKCNKGVSSLHAPKLCLKIGTRTGRLQVCSWLWFGGWAPEYLEGKCQEDSLSSNKHRWALQTSWTYTHIQIWQIRRVLSESIALLVTNVLKVQGVTITKVINVGLKEVSLSLRRGWQWTWSDLRRDHAYLILSCLSSRIKR